MYPPLSKIRFLYQHLNNSCLRFALSNLDPKGAKRCVFSDKLPTRTVVEHVSYTFECNAINIGWYHPDIWIEQGGKRINPTPGAGKKRQFSLLFTRENNQQNLLCVCQDGKVTERSEPMKMDVQCKF